MPGIDLSPYIDAVSTIDPLKVYGKVVEITGIIIKATGIRASIGESCKIFPDNTSSVDAEVGGFRDGKGLLMAVGDLAGIKLGSGV